MSEGIPVSVSQYNPPSSIKLMLDNNGYYEDSGYSETDATLVRETIEEVYSKCKRMVKYCERKAAIYKALSLISTLLIITGSAVIGGIASEVSRREYLWYVITILAIMIVILKGITATLSFEQKATLLKTSANRLKKVSKEVRTLSHSKLPLEKKISKIKKLDGDIDEVDMEVFIGSLNGNDIEKTTKNMMKRKIPTADSLTASVDSSSSNTDSLDNVTNLV